MNISTGEDHNYNFEGSHHEEEDLISNLPDGVISHILSHLTAKSAVQTSVLSRNWEYKWTSIYNFSFSDAFCELEVGEVRNNIFTRFIDRILDRTDNSRIRKFYLYARQKYDSNHLTRWIDTALKRKVEKLQIYYYPANPGERIVLPECLYSCDTLTKLELALNCTLELPLLNCFSQLKTLYITNSYKGDLEILNVQPSYLGSQLILDFPVLEKLTFGDCKWSNVTILEIRAPQLLWITIWFVNQNMDNLDFVIKITAPNLSEFHSGGRSIGNFVLCSPSVYSATLKYYSSCETNGPRAYATLKTFPCLKQLSITGTIIEYLIKARKSGLELPSIGGIKKLAIYDGCVNESNAFLEFLELVPYVEFLGMDVEYWHDYDYGQLKSMPTCLVTNVKEVKLILFSNKKNQIDILKFIWKNTQKLEKLQVVFEIGVCEKKIEEIKLLLLKLPKPSSSVLTELSIYAHGVFNGYRQLWSTEGEIFTPTYTIQLTI